MDTYTAVVTTLLRPTTLLLRCAAAGTAALLRAVAEPPTATTTGTGTAAPALPEDVRARALACARRLALGPLEDGVAALMARPLPPLDALTAMDGLASLVRGRSDADGGDGGDDEGTTPPCSHHCGSFHPVSSFLTALVFLLLPRRRFGAHT